MADLTSDCCSADAQSSCCEPEAKGTCCGRGRCGCSAGQASDAVDVDVDVRKTHRAHEHAGSAIVRAREPS